MSPRPRIRGRTIPALIGCFYAGIVVGWLLHRAFTPSESAAAAASTADVATTAVEARAPRTAATSGEVPQASEVGSAVDPIAELRSHRLRLPIDDANVEAMVGDFAERRDAGGRRAHEAVDILAPRNTPIRAVENGVIAKLFTSKAGGTTIYQFDPSQRFCYYYAHLERYAAGLAEGEHVSKGEVIGYVGTTGNAPANTPHLHFAILELNANRHWWEGTPIDPYLVFRSRG
jgi:murein DD-endopeptidase MepM/ murein hydrolase activator NlpD